MAKLTEHGALTVHELQQPELGWLLDLSFLGRLEEHDLRAVVDAMEWWEFAEGEELISIGQPSNGVHLVVTGDGAVRIPQPGASDGQMQVKARVRPGQVLGEAGVLTGAHTSAQVLALTTVRTLFIPADRFTEMLRRSPSLNAYVGDLVALRMRVLEILDLVLREPILRTLGVDDLDAMIQSGRMVRKKAGERVVSNGELSAEVYLLVRGEVAIYVPEGDAGRRSRVATRGPGLLFGHVALMMDLPRTADVEARTDVELLEVRGSAFMELLSRNPPMQRRLYQQMANLHIDLEAVQARRSGTRVLQVWSRDRGVGTTTLAFAIAATARAEGGKVTLVDLDQASTVQSLKRDHTPATLGDVPIGRLTTPGDWGLDVIWPVSGDRRAELMDTLTEQAADEDWIVVAAVGGEAPPALPEHGIGTTIVIRWAHDHSTHLDKGRKEHIVEVVRLEKGIELPLAMARNAVRLPEDTRAGNRFWTRGDLSALTDQRFAIGRAAARILRVITGRTVGLALGGGGALGFAHIGLLRALREADIPVDYIAGVSFGSIVGALYAAGGLELLDRLVADRTLVHYLIAASPISTRGMTRWVEKVTDGQGLGETEVPFFPVAMDIWSGQEVVLTRGSLADGMRASSSFPGVFPAFHRKSHRLVDGGIINNVPASVVWKAGANFIIASNIIPSFPGGRSPVLGDNFRAKFTNRTLTRVDDLLRSVFYLMSQTGRDRATLAEYVFNLKLQGFNIYDVKRGDEIYKAGLDQARGEIDRIVAAREADLHIPTARR